MHEPSAIRGSQRSLCASLPKARIAEAASVVEIRGAGRRVRPVVICVIVKVVRARGRTVDDIAIRYRGLQVLLFLIRKLDPVDLQARELFHFLQCRQRGGFLR